MSLQAIVVQPTTGEQAKGLIVALHGWGANAQDLVSLSPFLNLPEYQMVFPNAPLPHPYSYAGKMWYSFPEDHRFEQKAFQNLEDLATNRRGLMEWLQSLEGTTGIPLSRTVLLGFSQGGAMTLDVGPRLPLAGLVVLSGYLHTPIEVKAETIPPILMLHGLQDNIVPIAVARRSQESLNKLGLRVRYHELSMGHEVNAQALQLVREFIKANL